nr:hypothetical protein [Tanacetum cinerariifolium]
MRTRSQSRENFPQQKASPAIVEPLRIENPFLEDQFQEDPPKDPPEVPMTDNQTMAEMLRAPTEGYAEAIVVPLILAEQFELKHSLINMMTSDLRNEISNFEQKFGESFHEAWDRYKDLLRACPRHGFTELHQLNTFYNALNHTDQDSLNVAAGGNLLERSTQEVLTIIENKSKVRNSRSKSIASDSLNAAAGGNLLERSTQEVLTIIENKSKVRNSRSKSIASQVKACDTNSSSEIAKLTHAVNEQTSAMTTAMMAMLRQFQATPPPAPVKAVEETCVTCEAAVQYNQGNPGYRPPGMANQTRPLGPAQQHQNVHLNELEKVRRMNEANMKAMQTQIDMMASLLQTNTAFTSGSGSLPRNTVANPKGKLKAITTRSGLVINGPTVPTPPTSINPKVDERVEETFTDPDLAEYTIKVPPHPVPKYKPPSQREFVVHQRDPLYPNTPYPSRMLKQKQQEKDEVQIQKFWQMFKKLHVNVTLADALILMPKYQKMLKALLSNKEKLQELANTPLN